MLIYLRWISQLPAEGQDGRRNCAYREKSEAVRIVLDPLYTFSAHAMSIVKRASSRLNVMRALSDTSFGKDKECLLITHRAFIRSLFSYAAPIVYPAYSKSSIDKLQLVQNKSLQLALGCHSASSVDHLHAEAEELPVGDHLHLLSSQFLAQALQPHHTSHSHAILDQGRRKVKETLRSKCIDDVRPFLEADGMMLRENYHSS